jgi:uncharacterized DUF497 family protein
MKFAWDVNKNDANKRKHKTSFAEACFVFADKFLLSFFDDRHSTEEERWITMGQTPNGEILVVVHTYLNIESEEFVRIISARKATKKEVEQYFARRL